MDTKFIYVKLACELGFKFPNISSASEAIIHPSNYILRVH